MEALLEKEGTVENWNDDRLDELSGRVDAGFKEMREGFARVDARFAQMDAKFHAKLDQMDAKFHAKLDQMDAKFHAKFDRLGARLDKLFYIQMAFLASLAIGLLTDRI